jgi:hypothetical protein
LLSHTVTANVSVGIVQMEKKDDKKKDLMNAIPIFSDEPKDAGLSPHR